MMPRSGDQFTRGVNYQMVNFQIVNFSCVHYWKPIDSRLHCYLNTLLTNWRFYTAKDNQGIVSKSIICVRRTFLSRNSLHMLFDNCKRSPLFFIHIRVILSNYLHPWSVTFMPNYIIFVPWIQEYIDSHANMWRDKFRNLSVKLRTKHFLGFVGRLWHPFGCWQ